MKPARIDVAGAAVAFFAGGLVGALVELLSAAHELRIAERQAVAAALDELDELGGREDVASVAEWGPCGDHEWRAAMADMAIDVRVLKLRELEGTGLVALDRARAQAAAAHVHVEGPSVAPDAPPAADPSTDAPEPPAPASGPESIV